MAVQLAFYFDQTRCTGCKTCQIACKDKNNLPIGVRWRRVVEYSGGQWTTRGSDFVPEGVFSYYLSTSCMHCVNPPCAEVCAAGAFTKREEDGIVLLNNEECLACRDCESICPYGALHFNEDTGKMTKCDFCVDLLAKGERPACVDACPTRALDYGPLDELRTRYGEFVHPAPLPDPSACVPALIIKPHANAQTWEQATGEGMNPEERI